MKVLMVGPFPRDLERPVGGVAAAAGNLAAGLTSIGGVELQVVAHDAELAPASASPPPNIDVAYIPCRPGLRGWARDLHGRVMAEVRRRRYDVVHVQGIASLAARLPRSLLTVHGIPEVEARLARAGVESWLKGVAAYSLEALPRKRCHHVIAITSYTRAKLPTGSPWVWSIRNPIHSVFFEDPEGPIPRDLRAILYGGKITPGKNVAGLLRAFERVAVEHPGASLLIAGPGADSAYGRHCRDIVSSSGLASAVTFMGSLSAPEMAKVLRSVGTLALPSLQENAPMVIAEALACGTGVVATDVGGVSEMLRDLPGCCTVPVGDDSEMYHALADRIQEIDPLVEPVLRERARIYSPIHVARQTVQAYHEVSALMGLAEGELK